MLLAALTTTGFMLTGGCGFGGSWEWIAVGLAAVILLGGGTILGIGT
jgi:hypothetical protein